MEDFKTTLATFKVLVTDWDKFKTISKSRGETASSLLNEFIAQTIADEENLPPKVSPDKFITQENLVAAIAPLVARIEALEKGSGIVQIIDPPKGTEKYKPPFDSLSDDNDWRTAEQNAYERMQESRADNIPGEKVLEWLTVLEKGEPDIYTSEDGEPINDDSKPNPGQNNPDPTPSEVPDTIPVPTEFSQKTIDEVLNARPPVPEGIIYDHDGVDVTDPEMKRFFAGQLTHWTTVADALDFPRDHFESALASEKFQKEVETVICLDENLYRWIEEKKTPMEETDD